MEPTSEKIEHDCKITLYVDLSDHTRKVVKDGQKQLDNASPEVKQTGRRTQVASAGEMEDDDGIHDGCKNPRTSFDMRRLAESTTELSPFEIPAHNRVVAKVIRRAVLKENGGFRPGTTQIRGMKRRTVSPKAIKPHRRKRARMEDIYQVTKETLMPYSSRGEEARSSGMSLLLMATDPAVQRFEEGEGDGFVPKARRDIEKNYMACSDRSDGEELVAGAGCYSPFGGIALVNSTDVDTRKEEQGTRGSDDDDDNIIRPASGEPFVNSEGHLHDRKDDWGRKICNDDYEGMITETCRHHRTSSPWKDRKTGTSFSHRGPVGVDNMITVKTHRGVGARACQADGLPLQGEQNNQSAVNPGNYSAVEEGNSGPNFHAVTYNNDLVARPPNANFGGKDNGQETDHDDVVLEGQPRVKYPRSGRSPMGQRCTRMAVKCPVRHVSKIKANHHMSAFRVVSRQGKLSTRTLEETEGSVVVECMTPDDQSRHHRKAIHNVSVRETGVPGRNTDRLVDGNHFTVHPVQHCSNGPGIIKSPRGISVGGEGITMVQYAGSSRLVSDAGARSDPCSIQPSSTRSLLGPTRTSEASQGWRLTGLQHRCSAFSPEIFEVAGIKTHRRSWDAMKSAQIPSKKRINQTIGKHLPIVTSRFQTSSNLVRRGISESSPENSPSRQVLGTNKTRKSWQKPRKSGHERPGTRLSNRLAEKVVQRIDSSCCPNRCVYRCTINTSSSHGMRAVAPPKGQLRRGLKKADKEKLKANNPHKFKLLSESSGLLGEFNPGIISRVRNSRQIQSTLGTLIASVLTPSTSSPEKEPHAPEGANSKNQEEDLLLQRVGHTDAVEHQAVTAVNHTNPEPRDVDPQKCTQKHSQSTEGIAEEDAAELSGRWLELLTLDIRGRLSALKRSRRRVRSTLLSELLDPERGSAILTSPPADPASALRPCVAIMNDCSKQQMDRWRALFTNMDAVLCLEAAKLEDWLWQIQQTQSFCHDPSREEIPKSKVSTTCHQPMVSKVGLGRRG